MPNQVIQVLWHRRGSKLVGHVKDANQKECAISKYHKGKVPGGQELWWCEEFFDTNRTSPKDGLKYVGPIRPVDDLNERPPNPVHSSKRDERRGQIKGKQFGGVKPAAPSLLVFVPPPKAAKPAPASPPTVKVLHRWKAEAARTEGDEFCVKVTFRVLHDGKEVSRNERTVMSRGEVDARWPLFTGAEVQRLFAEEEGRRARAAERQRDENLARINAEQRAREATAAREVAAREAGARAATIAALEAFRLEREQLTAQLADPFDAVIESIERHEHKLQLRRTGGIGSDYHVLIDDADVGIYDSSGSVRFTAETFGAGITIRGATIALTNGTSFTVYSEDVVVLGGAKNNRRKTIYSQKAEVQLVDRKEVSWDEVAKAEAGTKLGTEHRFQAAGNYVTDGVWWFPRQRPEGAAEWRKLPVKTVPEDLYDRYVEGLIGKRFIGLLAYHKVASVKQKEAPEKPVVTDEQRRQFAKLTGKMFIPEGKCDCTPVDDAGMIWHLREDFHVLDKPIKHAIYLFRKREDAERVGNGELPRSEAMHLFPRILHVPGWEDEVARIFNDPAAEEALFASVVLKTAA